MFAIENYQQAHSIEDAVQLLNENPEARLLAGGTDVLVRLREGHKQFSHLIDIHHLEELQQITLQDNGTLTIGAGVTCTQLIKSELIQQHIPVLAQAADMLGGPQVRNAATLGGNICNGAPSAENASPLLVLNTQVHVLGSEGERILPVEKFYQGPGRVDLSSGELVTGFSIHHEDYSNTGGDFSKYAMRNAMDIATIGCSVVCRMDENRIDDIRIAFTVAAPVPTRCRMAENICKGAVPGAALLHDLAAVVHEDLKPRDSWRASKAFRQHIISMLVQRVAANAINKAGGKLL